MKILFVNGDLDAKNTFPAVHDLILQGKFKIWTYLDKANGDELVKKFMDSYCKMGYGEETAILTNAEICLNYVHYNNNAETKPSIFVWNTQKKVFEEKYRKT